MWSTAWTVRSTAWTVKVELSADFLFVITLFICCYTVYLLSLRLSSLHLFVVTLQLSDIQFVLCNVTTNCELSLISGLSPFELGGYTTQFINVALVVAVLEKPTT